MTPATAMRIRKRATGRACSPAWPEQVGPDDRRCSRAAGPASRLQPLEAQQPDVLGGHAESAERLQGRVGRIGVDVGGHERLAGHRCRHPSA